MACLSSPFCTYFTAWNEQFRGINEAVIFHDTRRIVDRNATCQAGNVTCRRVSCSWRRVCRGVSGQAVAWVRQVWSIKGCQGSDIWRDVFQLCGHEDVFSFVRFQILPLTRRTRITYDRCPNSLDTDLHVIPVSVFCSEYLSWRYESLALLAGVHISISYRCLGASLCPFQHLVKIL